MHEFATKCKIKKEMNRPVQCPTAENVNVVHLELLEFHSTVKSSYECCK